MDNMIDQDQQWLINSLNATLDTNQQARSFAEASLNQASLQPAAVLLKQFIKKHWQEDEDGFEHPVVSNEEKAVIRGLLLLSLDDPHRKICTAISMAVASVAHHDWPDEWPELLPFLLKLINDQSNTNAVNGALRCLALLSADLDDKLVPRIIPVLFPCLHTIVSSPQIYDKPLRTKALSIVYSCTSMLGVMSGVYKTETSSLMLPLVKVWMVEFSSILKNPVQSEDPDDWSIRMETQKTSFPEVLVPLWQTFVSSLAIYERSSVEGLEDSYEGRYDSDGSETSLESFIIQLFEFLLTIVGSKKFVKAFGNSMQDLVYYSIAFLQMTEQQVHAWSLDANQYVADEDENTYSCRVSGSLLLEEIVISCGIEGVYAILNAAKQRFDESQQERIKGSADWWRIREATLFALSSVSEQLLEVEVSGPSGVNLGNLLEHIFTEDMAAGGVLFSYIVIAFISLTCVHEYPFLYARMFSSIAKFSSVINHSVIDHFLYAAIQAIGMDVPAPVKVGACRALSQLLPDTNQGIPQPHILALFSSLTELLKQASDETMHLVLETLQAAVRAGHEAALSIEPVISPIILSMWALHVSDPFISIDALEVLEAIKNAPGCIHPLVSRVLPYVGPILNKNAPSDVVKAVYEVCFDPVIRTVLQSDDHSEMQNATQCLAALVSGGKQQLLAWSGDPSYTMRCLLDVASRLLDPDLESSGSLFVGNFILQLILHLSSQMAPHIRDLVAALVRRMQSCQIAGLRSSLLLIFARLVHMSAPHVEQFINLLITIPAEGYTNSLYYGAYQIKVTTTALALLLSSRHVEFGNINVQGYLMKFHVNFKSSAGITTRSKAKVAPDQWTLIPLPAKILAVLADVLLELQEQILEDDDRDEDDGYDDDLLSAADPLNESLTQAQKKAIQMVVS
ncbi:Armadillo-like helical [Cynara cardunculus var. scolymus]|uniref:Armadillo-like helical n=1 Tax=Cynara cardunculus var. scolymus TaxID=59895 RepID=A0A118JXR4_CYNCS|nr:Armadillo-like helical [Cynara cardunculus var. scolymus]